MKTQTPWLLGALAALVVVAGQPAAAAQKERIVDFRSEIVVNADSSLTVTETIKVVSARKKIKRGIYRDFPTTYTDRFGNTVRVGFEVVEVLRNGRAEHFRVTPVSNGMRVYIGRKKVFLKPGQHTYTITYRATRQLGFFDQHDELYWNVTGNGWAFPIDRARAVVKLPSGAPVLDVNAFTGRMGERGTSFEQRKTATGATFATTRRLDPGEGLTITVSWPKGYVAEPTSADEVRYFLSDNASLLAALVGLVVVLAYYLFVWNKVGRDPERGTIIPLFNPPEGFSPAAARFVMRMGFDKKAFAAAVVNMAVKGYLTIREDDDDEFVLEKTNPGNLPTLSPGERKAAKRLFDGRYEIALENKNHVDLKEAVDSLESSLEADFEKLHFLRNKAHFFVGAGLTLLAIVAIVIGANQPLEAGFMAIWLTGWTGGCYALLAKTVKSARSGRVGETIATGVFALPFLAGELFGLWFFATATSWLTAAALVAIAAVNILFYELLKAPTVKGRRVMDEIEGFKLYLTVAEKERLEALNPPDKTPELFEKYLPFALALDVENEWSEQFAGVLAAAGTERGYSPGWYHGRSWHRLGAGGLASDLGGSFSKAISSASTPPGSSSTGGGAGGGGGGGGGGGW